jgi:ATP-binding protein involved in chromosome partitioning
LKQAVSIQEIQAKRKLEDIGRVILVGSGKGGVGKSFVASGLALTLCAMGYRTGILDLDIHGASLLNYLEVSPPVKSGKNGLRPKLAGKLKVMSVALFTGNNAVPMRGEKKGELIAQLFSLTDWGRLDYLVVDLPPSTGDELLSAFEIFGEKCSLVLVTTPALNAVSVVSRLSQLAESERVPIQGIVLNMAYAREGRKTIDLFGKLDRQFLERELGARLLAKIPFQPRVNSQRLIAILNSHGEVFRAFETLAKSVADTRNQ